MREQPLSNEIHLRGGVCERRTYMSLFIHVWMHPEVFLRVLLVMKVEGCENTTRDFHRDVFLVFSHLPLRIITHLNGFLHLLKKCLLNKNLNATARYAAWLHSYWLLTRYAVARVLWKVARFFIGCLLVALESLLLLKVERAQEI